MSVLVRTCGVGLVFGMVVTSGCGLLVRVQGPPPPALSEGSEVLVRWLREHVGSTPSVKALLQVSLRAPRGSMSFDGTLFSERPSSLRLQGFGPLGQRLFDLLTKGEWVTLRIGAEPRYIEGPIETLGEGLQLPVLPQLLELMATLTIAPPDPLQTVVLEEIKKGDTAVLSFYLGSPETRQLTRRIWLDERRLPVREEWYGSDGRVTAEVGYSRYRVVEDRWQPYRIDARLTGDVAVTVTVRELQLNPVWKPGDFEMHREPHAAARG